MIYNRLKLAFVALLTTATFIAAGCSTAPPAGVGDEVNVGEYPKVVAAEGLQDGVVFSQPVVERPTELRPMRVTVPVRAITNYPLNVQYRFEFFDNEGRSLRNNQGWRFMNLPPKVQMSMDAASLDNDATDWRLIVRPAR